MVCVCTLDINFFREREGRKMFSKLTRVCLVFLGTLLLGTPLPTTAQSASNVSPEPILDHAWRAYEYPPDYFQAADDTNPRIYQEVDILHYTIDATFILGDAYPSTGALEAVVTINGQAKAETLNELIIDFYDNIIINSFKLNAIDFSNYTRTDNRIVMDLTADPLAPGESFEITVDYQRVYGSAFSGIMFRTHGEAETPAISTVSQPYFSPRWWPCFDVPGDKATADISMTFPDWMTAVTNGTLQSEVDNGDGTKTAHWQENHPLYTSVLALTMTDYISWTDTYVSPLDSTEMTLYYYAFPEDAEKAMTDFAVNKDAMEYFAQIYGEYPFIDEKYAIAETVSSMGSLENQTITGLTYTATKSEVNWDVIVHELGHQWWGDWVTCATWNHLWIHEGLATYSEVLFHEYDTGEPAGPFMAVNYDDGFYDGELAATSYVEDVDLVNPFSNTGSLYEKGAWIVHMLRYIIDDDTAFFDALKTFGVNHAHSTAVTDDLKSVMETAYGGGSGSLDDFFDQWLYTPYRPIYAVTYENAPRPGGYTVSVILNQTHEHDLQDLSGAPLVRDYYIMPIVFTVHYTDATTQTFTINNYQRDQAFELQTVKEPDYTVLDEGYNILKTVDIKASDNDGIPADGDNNGIPGDNPCPDGVTENCDDNCPIDYNPNQEDTGDGDAIGDVCDNCPSTVNPDQTDSDGDCIGDICDPFPNDYDISQPDTDGDGIGDACDECTDSDGDGYGDPGFSGNCLADSSSTYLADNCPDHPNSRVLGTCTSGKLGDTCTRDYQCNSVPGAGDGFCSMNQEDNYPPGGNGIGDPCECEGNFDCDQDQDGTDAANFKLDFGRSPFFTPCTNGSQCKGDFDCDVDVDGTDAALFKLDFGRSGFNNPCPTCTTGDWCSYPEG